MRTYPLSSLISATHLPSLLIIGLVMLTLVGCSSAEDAATTTTTQKTTQAPDMDILTAIDRQNMLVITQHMDTGTDPDYVPIPEGMPFE